MHEDLKNYKSMINEAFEGNFEVVSDDDQVDLEHQIYESDDDGTFDVDNYVKIDDIFGGGVGQVVTIASNGSFYIVDVYGVGQQSFHHTNLKRISPEEYTKIIG